jgi:glucose/arabinose dehydrogenase
MGSRAGAAILWRVPPRAASAAIAASILLLAGCGGCGNGSESGSGPTSAAAPASAKPGVSAARGVKLKKVGSFDSPIFVTAPRGDTHRLFVVERAGRIRVVKNGRKLSTPFLDISSQVRTDSERGLLSMAFAPDYARSGLFYVYFTDRNGDIHIQQFKRGSADRAAAGSARNLLTINHREFGNHDGGQLQFGPDGYLYAGVGDGGGAGDPHGHGQSLGTRLAKLLRIKPRAGGRYSVKGNPFVGRRAARKEIWAYGLRNPWRFSFDRQTGDLVIADVGQDSEEEIDFARRGRGKGANYGWNVFEGTRRYSSSGSAPGAVRPRVTHSHGAGYCSITGGYVVRDRSLGSLYGRYVYGDLCKSGIRSVKLGRSGGASGDRGVPGVSVQQLVSFGEDARGRVYVVSLGGPVYRLSPK